MTNAANDCVCAPDSSTLWLLKLVLAVTSLRSSEADLPHWRRHHASIAHNAGDSTGTAGPVPASEFNPIIDSTLATTVDAMFAGATGPLNATGTDCAASESACDDAAASAAPTCCGWAFTTGPNDCADQDPRALNADNRAGATDGVPATFDDTRGNAVDNPTGGEAGRPAADCDDGLPAVGGAPANELPEGTTGVVKPARDSVCAPPVLDTTPECGSPVAAELDNVDPETDAEPNPGVVAVALVDDELDCVPGVVAADVVPDTDGAVDDDDDAPGVELEDDESDADEEVDDESGSATASPGLPATAAPTPKATANAPTRPMCFA